MKRNPALSLIFASIIVILLLIGYFSAGNSSIDEIRVWDFKGVVERVGKSLTSDNVIITVSGKDYDLARLHMNPNIGIYKGDTIIKKKGDLVFRMIKPNSKDTIYCNKP